MKRSPPISSRSARRPGSGFTLTELLVVMGIVVVLATLTVVGVRGIARSARLASATNSVMAALDNARALAMKTNTIVLVVFRPRLEGNNKQVVEIVTAKWSGEAATVLVTGSLGLQVVDRFVPIPDVRARRLPRGTKVAGPLYRESLDSVWVTQSHLPAIGPEGSGEVAGQLIGVMYAPDGTTITRNSQTDSNRTFVDFNNNRFQDGVANNPIDYNDISPPVISEDDFNETYFDQRFEGEETYVTIVPFLSVYDDAAAREMFGADDWDDFETYLMELTNNDSANPPLGYIAQFADRIHFNRYTGVAMK